MANKNGLISGLRSRLKSVTRALVSSFSEKDDLKTMLDQQHILAAIIGQTGIYDGVQDTSGANQYDNIVTRYMDYEAMDNYDITSSMLDLYADDSVQLNPQTNDILQVKSSNSLIKEHLDFLYNKNLDVKNEAWSEARNLCKYGNGFHELVIKDKMGVIGQYFRPSPTMRRIEDSNRNLLGFIRDDSKNFQGFSKASFV